MRCELRIVSCQLLIVSCELQVVNLVTFCFKEEKKHKLFVSRKRRNVKLLFFCFGQKRRKTKEDNGIVYLFQEKKGLFPKEVEEKHETFVCLFQEWFVSRTSRKESKVFVYLFQWFVAACFKNRSKKALFPKEVEEKRETFVFLFQEKKGLFQEQEEMVLFFFYLFQEPLVSRIQRIKTFVFLFRAKKKKKGCRSS